ncbi:MAG: putative sugar nucleotidyl transferase [Bacteroidota bacterium]|nr:putative sugar nucleotidyl transferase [Bacteroidota bacterium]
MNTILFDLNRENYYPLSFTRAIADFRIGIFTIKEKWEYYYNNISIDTADHLQSKYVYNLNEDNLWINSSIIPTPQLVKELKSLRNGELLQKSDKLIAFRNSSKVFQGLNRIDTNLDIISIDKIWDIFVLNDEQIRSDFSLYVSKKETKDLSLTNSVLGDNIFVNSGVKAEYSTFNTESGPIYIGKNVEIMEGCTIRGPFAILENSILKMGAKIYGGTTLGPFSKVGGEVNNSVLFGYSSKAHDGFLGNSVIGEWCNFGAGSNNSNLKNNYDAVKLWNYVSESFESTNLQFCGLIMGDHSKCGINSMFNTGAVVGVSCNIYGTGFLRNFIPSFSWGGVKGLSTYRKEKVFSVIEKVMQRRNIKFSQIDAEILTSVFNMTKRYRNSD